MNIVTAPVYGFSMLYDRDFAAVKWDERPDFEEYMRPILARHHGLFIDGGCNAGFHTLSAVELGFDVIAVDANFLNAALVQKTVDLNAINEKVQVVHGALGKEIGLANVDTSFSNSCVGKIGPLVAMVTIDYLIRRYAPERGPGIIKLDIEGSEASALEGAIETIGRFRPTILAEHCIQLADDRLFSVLKDAGYEWKAVSKNEQPFTGEPDRSPENVYMYECTPRRQHPECHIP